MKLSFTQKVVKFFAPQSAFQKMEAESKLHRFTCPCGRESSIWDIGGIRYKATGNPKTLIKCPHCGKVSKQPIYKVGT